MIFRLPDSHIIEMRSLYVVTKLRMIYRIVFYDVKLDEWVLYQDDEETLHSYIEEN